MGGHSDLLTMFLPDGTAKDEFGKDIYYRDVDQNKLNAGRRSYEGISVSKSEQYPDDMLVPVNIVRVEWGMCSFLLPHW